jgi:GDPmannose 4,6-dehydratase
MDKYITDFNWPPSLVPHSLPPKRGAPKKVLITGITGQDGIYMTAFLLFHSQDCCEIHGIIRKNSRGVKILHQFSQVCNQIKTECSITLHHGDVTDTFFMLKIIKEHKFDYVYNFAA